MPRLRVRFALNRGRRGAPLAKLGKISEQAEKFLRALAEDCAIETHANEWLAVNFGDGSIEFDAEFQGDVPAGAAEIFARNLELLADYDPEHEGLNVSIGASAVLEYARIGSLIDPDEVIALGIYPPHRRHRPKWREITNNKATALRKEIEAPFPSYGTIKGILHAWFKEAQNPYFQIRELSSEALVRCLYPASLYRDVARAVQERTTVLMITGDILFDRATRQATELRAKKVDLIRMLSAEEFEQFLGSAPEFTGSMTTEELLDEVRGDD